MRSPAHRLPLARTLGTAAAATAAGGVASVAAAAAVLAALALLGGCAHGPAARTAAGSEPPPVASRAEEKPIRPAPEPPRMTAVPSEGTCAPEKRTPFALTSCCSGTSACLGSCVHTPSGEVGCACFDTPGGCREGQVCCRFRHACTDLKDCQPPE